MLCCCGKPDTSGAVIEKAEAQSFFAVDLSGNMIRVLQSEDSRDPSVKVKNLMMMTTVEVQVRDCDDHMVKPLTIKPGRIGHLCDIVSYDDEKAFDFDGVFKNEFWLVATCEGRDPERWKVSDPEEMTIRDLKRRNASPNKSRSSRTPQRAQTLNSPSNFVDSPGSASSEVLRTGQSRRRSSDENNMLMYTPRRRDS